MPGFWSGGELMRMMIALTTDASRAAVRGRPLRILDTDDAEFPAKVAQAHIRNESVCSPRRSSAAAPVSSSSTPEMTRLAGTAPLAAVCICRPVAKWRPSKLVGELRLQVDDEEDADHEEPDHEALPPAAAAAAARSMWESVRDAEDRAKAHVEL